MGIFDSREVKEYKRKQQTRQAIRKLKKHSEFLNKQKDMYIERAKDALIKGISGSYGIARSGLKTTLLQKKRVDEMLLNLELLTQQRDFAAISGSFVKGIDILSKELSRESSKIDFVKVSLSFNKAMGKSGIAADNLDDMLDNNNDAFAEIASSDDILDKDIDNLIGVEAAESAHKVTANIDKALKADTDAKSKQLDEAISKRLERLTVTAPAAKNTSESGAKKESNENKEKYNNPDKQIYKSVKPLDKSNESEKPVDKNQKAEDVVLEGADIDWSYKFNWDKKPTVKFDDIAGLDDVKTAVKERILERLKNPEKFHGYMLNNTAGLLLIGPPGTGKTMVAAAIANEVEAKFCAVKKGELLNQGVGNSEKAIKALFSQARSFKCAIICLDEIDALTSKDTRASVMKSIRSELLSEFQGMDDYYKKSGNMLYIIGTTNKPWDIATPFLRTQRFDDRIYVGLPDDEAREYMLRKKIEKINSAGIVNYSDDIDYELIVEKTKGFNGADINNLLEKAQIESANKTEERGERIILMNDFEEALKKVKTSVRSEDIEKLNEWFNNGGN